MTKSATMSDEFKSRDYETSASIIAPSSTSIANPAPLGLGAFGLTTFVVSAYNAGIAVGYHGPENGPENGPREVVIGLAAFYGGVVQILAGMWEFKTGNTFGATAFSSYGAFWLSYATIFIPAFNVIPSSKLDDHELHQAVGIYLLAWALFSLIMFLCTLRQNVASILLFGMLTVTFFLLAIGNFSDKHPNQSKSSIQAGGYTGLITAFIALYIVLANLANKEHTYFTLPIGRIGVIEEKFYK